MLPTLEHVAWRKACKRVASGIGWAIWAPNIAMKKFDLQQLVRRRYWPLLQRAPRMHIDSLALVSDRDGISR